jgi:hypothetical protein
MQKALTVVADFLQRFAVFESNVASNDMLNGLGHNQLLHSYRTLSVIKSKIFLAYQVIHCPGRVSLSHRYRYPTPERSPLFAMRQINYITALSKKEADFPERQVAIGASMLW